jgi:prepilin-type N-terminal cleavage/methylation domain-containing protein
MLWAITVRKRDRTSARLGGRARVCGLPEVKEMRKACNGRSEPNGFTLIELLIVLGIMGILAGVIAPTMVRYTSQAKTTRAEDDVKALGEAVMNFFKDTARFPIYQNGGNTNPGAPIYSVLITQGDAPAAKGAAAGWLSTSTDTFSNQLITNTRGYPTTGQFAWRGPYMGTTTSDPWRNRYMLNAAKLAPGVNEAVWVLSAGPNGLVETPFSQPVGISVLGGDDIGYRVK